MAPSFGEAQAGGENHHGPVDFFSALTGAAPRHARDAGPRSSGMPVSPIFRGYKYF